MAVFDYNRAWQKYKEVPMMLETIKRLQDFDIFHYLRGSNLLLAEKASQLLPHHNQEYIAWMTVCDGGLLFDTTLLSVQAYDSDLDISFSSLEEYNTQEAHQEFALPQGYFCIAIRSYGDPICLSDHDSKVYLWDCEQEAFDTIWDSFEDFLADETDTAIELIGNGDLEPIPVKMNGEDADE